MTQPSPPDVVIDALLKTVAEQGWPAVGVRSLLDDTGVPASSFYRHFDGRYSVVLAVSRRLSAQMLDSLAGWAFLRVGLDEHADAPLPALPRRPRTALVLGAEGAGLRHKTKQTCDALARLPTTPDFPSLNVSNAAAVALYELVRGRAAG